MTSLHHLDQNSNDNRNQRSTGHDNDKPRIAAIFSSAIALNALAIVLAYAIGSDAVTEFAWFHFIAP
jgi:hypothetical protein